MSLHIAGSLNGGTMSGAKFGNMDQTEKGRHINTMILL